MSQFILPLLVACALLGCSAKSEDILLLRRQMNKERVFYQFDKEYMLKTKKLREEYPQSLDAHMAYISARRGVKAAAAEYEELAKSSKGPLFKYLALRAKLMGLSYKDREERVKITKELEGLASKHKEIEASFDLAQFVLRDDKKVRSIAEKLYKERPNYLPYQMLWTRSLKANDEAEKILKMCEKGIQSKVLEVNLCANISDITPDTAPKFLDQRDELLKKLIVKTLKSKVKKDWRATYRHLSSLAEEDRTKKLKEDFITAVRKLDPAWTPLAQYSFYYGELDFKEFTAIEEMGKINKELDFKVRISKLSAIANDSSQSKKTRARAFSNLGSAYLNPAHLNKEEAYQSFVKSHKLEAGSIYLLKDLIGLILELNKDVDYGLELAASALETKQAKTEMTSRATSTSSETLMAGQKSLLEPMFSLQGQLYLKKGDKEKAKLSFLNSYAIEETEENSFFLGEIYQTQRPMLALDFLLKSFSYKSDQNPLNDDLSLRRDSAIEEIHTNYLAGTWNKKATLELYHSNDKNSGDKKEDKPHPFIGKPLVKDKLADFRGGDFDWEKLKGKRVILSFWATWCTPCFQEMAVLNKLKKQGKLKNFKIVAVCTDGLSQKTKVKKIVKNAGIDFEILLGDGSFRDKYMVSAIPSMFFLNEKGIFIKQKTGYSPELEKEIFKTFK